MNIVVLQYSCSRKSAKSPRRYKLKLGWLNALWCFQDDIFNSFVYYSCAILSVLSRRSCNKYPLLGRTLIKQHVWLNTNGIIKTALFELSFNSKNKRVLQVIFGLWLLVSVKGEGRDWSHQDRGWWKRECVLLGTICASACEYHRWWIHKIAKLLQQLTRSPSSHCRRKTDERKKIIQRMSIAMTTDAIKLNDQATIHNIKIRKS